MTSTTPSPRGFTYALEPVRQRRQWQLDAQLARLAARQQVLGEQRAELEQIEQGCDHQAALAARFWTERPDPRAQARLLGYLALLQQRRADTEREIAALAEAVEQERQECVTLQQRLEALDQHRSESVAHYVVEHHRKAAAEADRDWLARSSLTPAGDPA
jgi:hypothetical protein